MIDFANFDLNLLKIFDVIMQERNLTQAADRLGKSVAGVSHALRRLREELGDELFESPGRGMVPTRRALEIAPAIREALVTIRHGLTTETVFDPKSAQRRFVIDLPIGAEMILAPYLMAYIEQNAPNVSLQIFNNRANVVRSELRYGETELAIDYEAVEGDGMRQELLYNDRWVLLSRKGHSKLPPPDGEISLDLYQTLRHIGSSWTRNKTEGPLSTRLESRQIERDIGYHVPSMASIPSVVESTELVCALSERVARYFTRRWELQSHPLAFEMNPIPIYLAWHQRHDTDPGITWLREAMKISCENI
ncbi:MAG: LysR family transcriptional regulator [Hyphomicrobiaceae bacterium]